MKTHLPQHHNQGGEKGRPSPLMWTSSEEEASEKRASGVLLPPFISWLIHSAFNLASSPIYVCWREGGLGLKAQKLMTLPGLPGNLTQDAGLMTSTAQPHKNLVIQDADIENRLVDTVGDGEDRMNGEGKMN